MDNVEPRREVVRKQKNHHWKVIIKSSQNTHLNLGQMQRIWNPSFKSEAHQVLWRKPTSWVEGSLQDLTKTPLIFEKIWARRSIKGHEGSCLRAKILAKMQGHKILEWHFPKSIYEGYSSHWPMMVLKLSVGHWRVDPHTIPTRRFGSLVKLGKMT